MTKTLLDLDSKRERERVFRAITAHRLAIVRRNCRAEHLSGLSKIRLRQRQKADFHGRWVAGSDFVRYLLLQVGNRLKINLPRVACTSCVSQRKIKEIRTAWRSEKRSDGEAHSRSYHRLNGEEISVDLCVDGGGKIVKNHVGRGQRRRRVNKDVNRRGAVNSRRICS